MTGTLKARVGGQWVPVAGSGQDAANVARWNSAWGTVTDRTPFSDQDVSSTTPVAIRGVTVDLVAGRRYVARLSTMATYCNVVGDTYGVDITVDGTASAPSYFQVDVVNNYIPPLQFDVPFTTTTGSHTINLRTWRVGGSGNQRARWGFSIEDVGPVTPASIAPPTAGPRVVASGNSLGVVAVGALTNQAGQSLAQAAWANLSQPLNVTLSAGRRYRVSFAARAVQANGSANVLYRLSDNGTPWGERHQLYAGQYLHLADTWLVNGDGALHQLYVQVICNTSPLTVYTEMNAGASEFYVEDIGPSTSPALPIPETPPAWTPLTLTNGWAWYGGAEMKLAYRKMGDMVQVRGSIKNTTAMTSPSVLTFAVLPVGFRPAYTEVLPAMGVGSDDYGCPGVVMAQATDGHLRAVCSVANPRPHTQTQFDIQFSTTP